MAGTPPLKVFLTGRVALETTTLVLGIAPAATAANMPPPSASEFAALFVSSTTAYARAHSDLRRTERPDCVAPVRGRYMCSSAVRIPGLTDSCHLMRARWTPERASLFTVTLAGRTRSCKSLKDALHSPR
jgi:hypothetical protein